jgi:hypothetical protein
MRASLELTFSEISPSRQLCLQRLSMINQLNSTLGKGREEQILIAASKQPIPILVLGFQIDLCN